MRTWPSLWFHVPSKCHRHNSSSILSNLKEGWFCHIKVLQRRVAPTTIIVGQSKVWRTEVCSSDNNGARLAPSWIIITPHFITCPTTQAIVEQSSAQSCSVGSISLTVQIPIATCTSCMYQTKGYSKPLPYANLENRTKLRYNSLNVLLCYSQTRFVCFFFRRNRT